MTSLSDLLNAGTEVTVAGETFSLRKPTLAEEGAFSKWLKDGAKREAATVPPGTPADVAEEMAHRQTRAVMRDISAGYFEPLAEGNVAAKQRPDGMAEFLYLVMRTTYPDITREKVKKLVEDGIAQEFLRVVAAEADDPTGKLMGGLCVALGLPPDFLTSSPTSSSASATPPSTGSPTSGVP